MTAAAQSPLGKLPLALEESFSRSDQGWMDIQNREIEFHRWWTFPPIQTTALEGLQSQLMITIYPLSEGKPPPLKANVSRRFADLASRCYIGGRRRIRCELLGVFP